MSRIVVTGGSGRLGRSVVRALAESGHDVTSLDRVPVDELHGFRVMQRTVDLTDTAATRDVFLSLAPEAVVHLAAIAVPFSAPEEVILSTNVSMVWNVLSASAEAGATQVLVASSPTVIGYGAPQGWRPAYLPMDEEHPVTPWNAYALSKQVIENAVQMAVARDGDRVTFGVFRPCFVISPEEWNGAPTQQGHTVRERLDSPELAAVSLFNYVDARDAASFVSSWLENAHRAPNGSVFFVGADDALARDSLDELVPRYLPGTEELAAGLTGTRPAFSSAKAARLLGWKPEHDWRTELEAAAAGQRAPIS